MAARNAHLNKSFRTLVSKRPANSESDDLFSSGSSDARTLSALGRAISTAISKRLFYCLYALLPAINTSGNTVAVFGCVWMAVQPIALALRPAPSLAWSDTAEMVTFGSILQASLLWPTGLGTNASYNLLEPAFAIGVSLVAVHVIAFAAVSAQALEPDMPAGALFLLLKHISALSRGIMFIPTTIWLLGPLLCHEGQGWAAGPECTSTGTAVAAIVGILLIALHIGLCGLEIVTLVDRSPKSGFKAAISGRPMLASQLLNCTSALVTLFSFGSLSAVTGLATVLVISVIVLAIWFYYQPFLSSGINLLFMSSAVGSGWVAFMRLISWGGGEFSQATALTAISLLPISWTIAYALQKWRHYAARVLPLAEAASAADIQLKLHQLLATHSRLDLPEDSALDLAADILRVASHKLRSSTSIHILYDNFLQFYRRNKYLEQSQIEHLVEKTTAIDDLFYAFRRRLVLSEEQESSAHMGVAARIQFDRKQAEALQLSVRTRGKLLAFWVELADSKEPNISAVHELAGTLSDYVVQTREAFENLMALNPSHVGLLRQHAQFLLEVSNDVERGHALLEEAENIEDVASRRHAQPHGSFSFMGKSILDAADEGIGILTASAELDTLGEVTSCNANALRMFGFGRREILGKSISNLMPEPISSMHNALLQRYLQSGVEQVTGTTRLVFGLHRTHTIFPMFLHVKAMDVGFGALTMPFRTSEGFFIFSGRSATVSAACQRSLTKLRLSPEDVAAGQVSMTPICPNITTVIRAMSETARFAPATPALQRHNSGSSDMQSVLTSATKHQAEDAKQLVYVPTLFHIQNSQGSFTKLRVSVRVTRHDFSFPKKSHCFVLQWHEADPIQFSPSIDKASFGTNAEALVEGQSDSGSDSVAALLDDGDDETGLAQRAPALVSKQAADSSPTKGLTVELHDACMSSPVNADDQLTSDSKSHVHSVRTTGSATSALQTLRRLVSQSEKSLDPGLKMLRNAFAAIFVLAVLVSSISTASVVSKLSAFADADDLLHVDSSRQLSVLEIGSWVRNLDLTSDLTLLHFPGDPRSHPTLPPSLVSTDSLPTSVALSDDDRFRLQAALAAELIRSNEALQVASKRVFEQVSAASFQAAHSESVKEVPALIRLQTDKDLELVLRKSAQVTNRKSSLVEATDLFVAAVNDVWTSFRLTNTSNAAASARDFILDNGQSALRVQQIDSATSLETIQAASFSSLYSVPEQVFLVIAALADIVLLAGVIPLIQRVERTNDRVVAAFLNVPQAYLQNLRKKCKANLDRMVYSLAADGDGDNEPDDFGSQSDSESADESEAMDSSSYLSSKNRQRLFGLGAVKQKQRASKKSQAAFFFLLIKFGGPLIALLAYLMTIYFWTFIALNDLQFSSSNIVLGYNRLLHAYSAGVRVAHAVQVPTWNLAYRQELNASIQLAWNDITQCKQINRKLVFGDAIQAREAEVHHSAVSQWMLESACAPSDATCRTFQNGAVQFNGLSNVLQRYLDDIEGVLVLKALEANSKAAFISGIEDLDDTVFGSLMQAPAFSVAPNATRCSMRDRQGKDFDNVLASFAASTGNTSWLSLGALDANSSACNDYRRDWARVSPLPEIQTLQNSFLLTGLLRVLEIKSAEVRSTVDFYSTGMIVVTISMSIFIFAFFFLVYVPLVRAMDQGMKRTRSLLLLFPEEALMYIPSLKKAMRSAAMGVTQSISSRSMSGVLSSRVRRVRNASRVFPSRSLSQHTTVAETPEHR